MWASTLWPFSSSMRNIALGRGSTTRPSTSMAPSFLAITFQGSSSWVSVGYPPEPAQHSLDLKRRPMLGKFRKFLGQGTQKAGADDAPLLHDTRIAALRQNA